MLWNQGRSRKNFNSMNIVLTFFLEVHDLVCYIALKYGSLFYILFVFIIMNY